MINPTDAEIMELMPQEMRDDLAAAARALVGFDIPKVVGACRVILNRHAVDHARAVLDKWGNSQGILDGSPQPVPVSKRLPKSEDCNGDGEVWAWQHFDPEEDMDNGDFWCLAFCEWLEDEDCNFTHWLPANAIPTPAATND